MEHFNCIIYDFNKKEFVPYDVIPYLVDRYDDAKGKEKPKTLDEYKKFVKDWAMYQWWSRTEYEIVLQSWPGGRKEEKVDIYWQVMMNIDLVAKILMEVCAKKPKKKKRTES